MSEVLAQVLEQQRAEPPCGVLGDPVVDARYRGILRKATSRTSQESSLFRLP